MKSPLRKTAACVAAFVSIALFPSASPAAFDAFIKIEGVKGESTNANHREWIEIQSFQHGVSQPAVTNTGSGRAGGRSVHEPLLFTKYMDSASPYLNLYVCQGKHLRDVRMEVCESTPEKRVYYTVWLKDVIISSIRVSAPTSDTEWRARETVSLSYGEITWEYKPASGSSIKTGWSDTLNREK